MRHNAFTVFITAFAVVLGAGLSVAALAGPEARDEIDIERLAFGAGTEPSDADIVVVEDESGDGAPTGSAEQSAEQRDEADVEKLEAVDDTRDEERRSRDELIDDHEEQGDGETFIEIAHPVDGQVFAEKRVVFEGTTEPGASVHAGRYEADVDDAGGWRIVLFLSPGEQTATFEAVDAAGNVASASVTIALAPDRVESDREFTIHQKVGESREPWEKFYGTGAPGVGVVARSEYGSADTRIGENGEWQLPIEFHGLTRTTTFPITVTTTQGFSRVFEFTFVAPVHEFTANQQFGSCSESPPYDVFWGTAVPGSVVEIGSPYGSARIEIGDGGMWEKKVFFEDAPVGEPFEVVVADTLGNTTRFAFVRMAPDTEK